MEHIHCHSIWYKLGSMLCWRCNFVKFCWRLQRVLVEVGAGMQESASSLCLVYGMMGRGWLLLICWCDVLHFVGASHGGIFVVIVGHWFWTNSLPGVVNSSWCCRNLNWTSCVSWLGIGSSLVWLQHRIGLVGALRTIMDFQRYKWGYAGGRGIMGVCLPFLYCVVGALPAVASHWIFS